MSQAKWIWYNGDYELYHSMKLHSRRTEFDAEYPPFWTMPAPNPNAVFTKRYHADEDDVIHVVAPHKAYITVDYYTRYPVNTDIPVPAGDHIVQVFMLALEGFPPSTSTAAISRPTRPGWRSCRATFPCP